MEKETPSVQAVNLKTIIDNLGLTQAEVGRRIGVTGAAISKWERTNWNPGIGTIKKIASALGVSSLAISEPDGPKLYGPLGKSSIRPGRRTAPLVGNIAAGTPLEAIVADGEPVFIPDGTAQEYPFGFALKVTGDSMDRILPPGIVVYVVQRDRLEIHDRDIVVVNVNGYDATIKRIFFAGDTVVLHPESHNPENQDMIFDRRSASPSFRIIGKVVWAGYPEDVRL